MRDAAIELVGAAGLSARRWGVLMGLVALAGFVAVYGRLAARHDRPLSLAAGWLAVLAVPSHRDAGTGALAEMLRGMLAGMAGFVTFCLIVAVLITRTGLCATFLLATQGAQARSRLATVRSARPRPRSRQYSSSARGPRSTSSRAS